MSLGDLTPTEQAIEKVEKLMKARLSWFFITTLKATGVSCALQVTRTSQFLWMPPKERTVAPDSKLFQEVLAMREATTVIATDYVIRATSNAPWYTVTLTAKRFKALKVHFNYGDEPHPFGCELSKEELMMELAEFSQPLAAKPLWFQILLVNS